MYQSQLCNALGPHGTFILGKKQYFHELLWDDEGLSQKRLQFNKAVPHLVQQPEFHH